MPFKLIKASVTFQRYIMFVLREFLKKKVLIYLNNILIVSKTREEHKRMIKKVHKLLAEADLHQKKKKCKYFQSRIKFLKFILTEEKIRKDSEKLKCIYN